MVSAEGRVGLDLSPAPREARRERQGGGSEPWHTGRGELKLKWGT